MKRKKVFSTCGCVLAMGMAISAVSVQAAVYSSISGKSSSGTDSGIR